jgi:hypothetical protein
MMEVNSEVDGYELYHTLGLNVTAAKLKLAKKNDLFFGVRIFEHGSSNEVQKIFDKEVRIYQ